MGCAEVVMPENYIAMFNAPEKEEAVKIVKKADVVIKNSKCCLLSCVCKRKEILCYGCLCGVTGVLIAWHVSVSAPKKLSNMEIKVRGNPDTNARYRQGKA